MSIALLFHYLLLNMFRMLVHPSSGACDLIWIYFMCSYPYAGWSSASGIASFNLNHGTLWWCVVNFTPRPIYSRESTLVPIEQGVVWPPEPFRTVWRRRKSVAPHGIQTLDHPARSLVTILTALSRLPMWENYCSVSRPQLSNEGINYEAAVKVRQELYLISLSHTTHNNIQSPTRAICCYSVNLKEKSKTSSQQTRNSSTKRGILEPQSVSPSPI